MAFDRAWLESNCGWKDFGNGSRMGKLKREAGTGLVLYHIKAGAPDTVFCAHTHTGGEMYLVLEGEAYDADGVYPKGSLVWMKPGSRHSPRRAATPGS